MIRWSLKIELSTKVTQKALLNQYAIMIIKKNIDNKRHVLTYFVGKLVLYFNLGLLGPGHPEFSFVTHPIEGCQYKFGMMLQHKLLTQHY